MAIDFPSNPITGQIYSYDNKSWRWNGVAWDNSNMLSGDIVLPAGSIIQWTSSIIPANWLLCDGSAVSRSAYPSLFAAIGTSYGAGNGTTTFNLPDLRGRVAVGRDLTQTEFDTLGETGGAKTHTLTTSEIPSHTHTGTTNTENANHTHNIPLTNRFVPGNSGLGTALQYTPGGGDGSQNIAVNSVNHTHTFTTAATGGGSAHNNLQPYQVFNYIIKTSAGTTAADSELAVRIGVSETDINSLESQVTTLQTQINPAGAVQYFAMNNAPSGWLKANGAAVSRTVYSSLFANIGTTYGGGDGSSTFNLPDLRGEFLRSLDDGRGVDGGRSIGSFQDQSWKTLILLNTRQNSYDYTHGEIYINSTSVNQGNLFAGLWSAPTGAIGGRFGGEEVRPRNRALLACIKF